MIRLVSAVAALSIAILLAPSAARSAETYRGHGLAMHGDLKYKTGYRSFGYVNPAAAKGGAIRLGAQGSYDSFNPFIIKGTSAIAMGLIYDSLMVGSDDEPFSMYCLLCESVETPADRSWVAFTLRADARWHDGKPVTAEDVIWTFETLKSKGTPGFRFYYGNVSKVKKTGPRTVKFSFSKGENRELPLILGQLSVLPKHYWQGRDFESTTLEPPLGSGPYRIESFEPGRSVTYQRVAKYWGGRHPARVGHYNFDRIRYDYYRDTTVMVEAVKGGAIDYRDENSARHWSKSYDVPALTDGRLVKDKLPHGRSVGMQGFVFNTRRPIFKDRAVRQALAYAYDFEWTNRSLQFGQYARTRSFFQNSELAATSLPQGRERDILSRFSNRLPRELFSTEYQPPKTDGTGNNRPQLRKALDILRSAGWDIDKGTRKLTHKKSGREMKFEVLLVQPELERIVLPMKKNLARLGIEISVRTVDASQYIERRRNFDFDMIIGGWGQSLSPGNEQRSYWSSKAAGQQGSSNFAGLENSVVDQLAEMVIAAPNRAELVYRTRALDRALQWQYIVIPQYHIPYDRAVYWNRFSKPATVPIRGADVMTWWIDPAKDQALRATGRGKQN